MKRIVMPKLGLRSKEAEIVLWHKKERDHVTKGEVLLDIVTEKANVEIEAPATGVLSQIMHWEGEVVKVGETIALILSAGETLPRREASQRVVRSTPAAKRLCREAAIPVEEIHQALGKEPITEQDVRSYLAQQKKTGEKADLFQVTILSPTRKVIARRIHQSASEKPHIYLFSELNMSSLLKTKERLAKKTLKNSLPISLTRLIVKITATVLTQFPAFNATLVGEGDELILRKYKHINIGIAVATEQGLVVPVIKDVGAKNISALAAVAEELITRSRQNKLSAEDMTGGTFTITNLGMYGVTNFIPIINSPEVAIMALGVIQEKLSLDGDTIAKIPVMSVCLGIDHRVLDGVDGAKFLQRLKSAVENPPSFSVDS